MNKSRWQGQFIYIIMHPSPGFTSALWFHNTLAQQFGVGVNVFWRHLPADSYDKKDPYGNKDPVAASRALQALERALKTLDELPADYMDFYGRRMIQRIQKRTFVEAQVSDSILHSGPLTKPGWAVRTSCLRYHSAPVTEMIQINQHWSTFDCHIYLQYLLGKRTNCFGVTQAKGFRGMEVQLSLVNGISNTCKLKV